MKRPTQLSYFPVTLPIVFCNKKAIAIQTLLARCTVQVIVRLYAENVCLIIGMLLNNQGEMQLFSLIKSRDMK